METVLIASPESWLHANSPWIVPLAAVISAAAVAIIGVVAAFIAISQREVAGMAELNKLTEKLNSIRYLDARKMVAKGYFATTVETISATLLLNITEDLAVYEKRKFIRRKTLHDMYGAKVICWWYAMKVVVDAKRAALSDPSLWNETQRLVCRLHKCFEKEAPEWGTKPSERVLGHVFLAELEEIDRAEKLLRNAS